MHGFSGPLILGATLGFVVAMSMSPTTTEPVPARQHAVQPETQPPVGADTIRLGTYDSRAIAMAWARSEHNEVHAKMNAHREAKAAGDDATVAELERWGLMKQRELHFQGFGTYPVDACLAPIRDELPALMARKDLDAIVWMVHAQTGRVERVDVTVDLMVLLGMDRGQAVQAANAMRTIEPLDFATLYEMDPRN
jgi:hypothetical protein